jgi:hypothetical protein
MKTTGNTPHPQSLEDLFREIRLEAPSAHFTEKLNARIEKELRKKERKRQWATIGQIAAGVLGILSVPAGVIYWKTGFVFSFALFKKDLPFDPLAWTIGLAILLVLIGDCLLRKYSKLR